MLPGSAVGAPIKLATITWGNVSTKVLLTLLSDSVLAGIYARARRVWPALPTKTFKQNAIFVGGRLMA